VNKFNLANFENGFRFNTIGILNTKKEKAIYRIKAQIG
jgi:hypothetical protein